MSVCRTGNSVSDPAIDAALSSATTTSDGTPLHGALKISRMRLPASMWNGTPRRVVTARLKIFCR